MLAKQPWPVGHSAMADRIRSFDWGTTVLGPIEDWPDHLRHVVDLVIACGSPMVALWGPSLVQIYNDSYRNLMGDRYGDSLGQPASACWLQAWRISEPIFRRVQAGETVTARDDSGPLVRCGPAGDTWSSLTYSPLRAVSGTVAGVLVTLTDLTDRVKAEMALRSGEERQAFLLAFSDALRPLTDATEIPTMAVRLLAEHLDVAGATYFEVGPDQNTLLVAARYERDPLPIPQRTRLSDIAPEMSSACRTGRRLVFRDTETETQLASRPEVYRAIGVRAWVAVPIVENDRLVAIVGAHSRTPRDWTESELRILEDVADRTWTAVERARMEADLRSSEASFRSLVENVRDYAIFRLNRGGIVTDWTAESERITGWDANEIIGQSVARLYPPDILEAGVLEDELAEAAATGRSERAGWRLCKNGDRFWADEVVSAVRDEYGTLTGFVKIARDLTERRATDAQAAELRLTAERAALLESVMEAIPDGMIITDRQLRGILVNRAYRECLHLDMDPEFFCQTSEERAGRINLRDVADRPFPRDALPAVRARNGEIVSEAVESRMTALNGVVRELSLTAAPLRNAEGEITGTVVAIRDVAARRKVDAERERLAAELRLLSRRLLLVQEEERRRLALELHDEIGQMLTGLGFLLGAGIRLDGESLAEARRITMELTEQVRRLSMDLRPSALDAYGLVPALRWLLDRFGRQTGLQTEFRQEGAERRFPAAVEIAAFRIVQEALTNAARHGAATNTLLQLIADEAFLTISIQDDGRGFDFHAVEAGSGLAGMRERAELLGGTIAVDSSPGEGVSITVELPLKEAMG